MVCEMSAAAFDVRLKNDTEVVIADVRREIVPHDPVDPLVGLPVNDARLKDFDQREGIDLPL